MLDLYTRGRLDRPFLRAMLLSAFTTVVFACGAPGPTAAGTPADEGGSSFGPSGSSDAALEGPCAATKAATTKATVDIIFVIDRSGSMGEEIRQVRTNLNAFAARIGASGLDYHVLVLARRASSVEDDDDLAICVAPPLARPGCADGERFHLVNQDVTSHDSLERILESYDAWKKHLRLDATKVFVEVTDDESRMPADEFDAALRAKEPLGMFGTDQQRRYVFHSIVSMPSGAKPPTEEQCASAAGPSIEYQKLSLLTGGIIDEVCKEDYSRVLDGMAQGIVDRLACEVAYPSAAESDPAKVVMEFTPSAGPAKSLTHVSDASKCGQIEDGWFYDDDSRPTKMILCPTTCATANATGGQIEALVGCKAPAPR